MPQDAKAATSGGFLPQFRTDALIAVGSNLDSALGRPAETVGWAMRRMGSNRVRVVAVSALYETPCFPPGAGPDYVNAACRVTTDLPAPELLARLHALEAEAGRKRVQRWGQRTLDLDLIAMGTQIVPDADSVRDWIDLSPDAQVRTTPDRLLLPHPRLQDRAFVLVPLLDVAPDWRHPMLGQTVREMAAALDPDDLKAVKPLVNRSDDA